MANKTNAEKIQELKNQIAALQNDAVNELREKETQLETELESVRAQIAELTGETATKEPKAKSAKKQLKLVSATRLKELIQEADGKTLVIRNAGLDTANVKKIVQENPKEFTLGGKTPWFTVSLKK